jgi:hypothetical protein
MSEMQGENTRMVAAKASIQGRITAICCGICAKTARAGDFRPWRIRPMSGKFS